MKNCTPVAVKTLTVNLVFLVVTTKIPRSAVLLSLTKVAQKLKMTDREKTCHSGYLHALPGRRQLLTGRTHFGKGYGVPCLKLLTSCVRYQLIGWRHCLAKYPLLPVRDFCRFRC